MNVNILIVLQDPEQREVTKYVIKDHLEQHGHKAAIDGVANLAEARERLDNRAYHLLVVHDCVPEDRTTAVNTAEHRGLALLQSVKEQGETIPGILIAPDANIFSAVQRLDRAGLVVDGTETWEDELRALCDKFLAAGPPAADRPAGAPEKLGRVDIILKLDRNGRFYLMDGVGFKFHVIPQLLQLDSDEIDDLIHRSRNVGELSDWNTELQAIGKKILKQLFDKNKGFSDNFRALATEVGSEEKIRIRFVVEENIHPLALEALVDERGEYRMLHSPIFRTVLLDQQGMEKSDILFMDKGTERQPINCLIIVADTWGAVKDERINSGREIVLARLENVMQEATELHSYLSANREKFHINDVAIVAPSEGSEFAERLDATLSGNIWHLVHFAGHSYYDTATKTGFLFYPGKVRPVPVASDIFSHTLRFKTKTQLVYLSSCQSSGADFVLGLARQDIPAIVGFRWEIDDDKAAEYAATFYKNLFEGNKSLPFAFLETRREMYLGHKDNRIWAAAMLIIQGGG